MAIGGEGDPLALATERFFEWERRHALFELDVDGDLKPWRRIRFLVHRGLLRNLGAHESADPGDPSLGKKLRMAARGLRRVGRVASAPVLFVTGGRRLRHAGAWWDPYCDPLVELLEAESRIAESPHCGIHHVPTPGVPPLWLDRYDVAAGLAERLASLRRLDRRAAGRVRSIERDFRAVFDTHAGLERLLRRALTKRAIMVPLHRTLLRRIKPELLFVVCAYGKEDLIEAAQSLGIEVIELQHGVITRYHVGYSSPCGWGSERRGLPDRFFTWGSYWEEEAEMPWSADRVQVIGFPFFDRVARGERGRPASDTILFVSQPAVSERLSKFAVEAARKLDGRAKVLFKPHPAEKTDAGRHAWLEENGVRMIDPHDSIYDAFAAVTCQVGVFSTAMFEGVGLGLPTGIVQLPGAGHVQRLIESGAARRVDRVEDVGQLLDEAQHRGPLALSEGHRLFAPDSARRFTGAVHAVREARRDGGRAAANG